MLEPSAHFDTFVRDHLPPPELWPEFLHAGFDYPEHINVAAELTDRMVEKGFGDHTALIGHGRLRTYKELADWTNRLARALVDDLGIVPGNRILIRSANNPAMVACWLAALKAGAVVVNTVPSLKAADLTKMIDKAEVKLALCDTRLMNELVIAAKTSRFLKKVIGFDGTANFDAELDRIALAKAVRFQAAKTSRDDAAIIAFSTGATGEPKAAVHFHRDLLAIADGYAKEVLGITPDDVVVGTTPLAFTFGLGGLVDLPAPLRRGVGAVRGGHRHRPRRRDQDLQGDHRVCRALDLCPRPRAEALAGGARVASDRGVGGRCAAGEDFRGMVGALSASRSSTASAEPRCCTSSSAAASATRSSGASGRPVAGYEVKILDDGHAAKCRAARWATSRCAARPDAAISTIRASAITSATAGT